MNEQIHPALLAPAAGQGMGKMLFERLLARPDFINLMVEAAIGGLDAVTWRYDLAAKEWKSTPDHKVRVNTLFMLLCHGEGEPIKRVLHNHLIDKKIDMVSVLRESPGAQDALQHALDKARFRDRSKKVTPELVESVPE